MGTYIEMKTRHQKEVNNFPIYFAFSNYQVEKMLVKLGLNPKTDLDKISAIPGTGGFILDKDIPAYRAMIRRHNQELQDAIASDEDGTGFVYQMFRYELINHEFGYTWDSDDALASLGYTEKQIKNHPVLKNGFEKAKQDILNP